MTEATQGAKKLKITCIQMDAKIGCPEENCAHAEELIVKACEEGPDVVVLPEGWKNLGPLNEKLAEFSSHDGDTVKQLFGGLAKKYNVNIVAGTVPDMHGGKIYNTAFVFDRQGACVATYDKTHLCFPGEASRFAEGDSLCSFMLEGVKCGILTCNDLRFPEATRTLALDGIELLFVPSAWPDSTLFRLRVLVAARAIENQMFVVNCNACWATQTKVNGGESTIVDAFGRTLAVAGTKEELISAVCDMQMVATIRDAGQSFLERRRPDVY